MISYETAKRLAKLEESLEKLKAMNARCLEAEARGALGWGNKGNALGREAYLSRILPAMQSLADAGDEDVLKAALDAEDGKEPEPKPSATIAGKIRETRNGTGMTQKDLAEAVGTTQAQIAKYETGAQEPSASRLLAIAEALNVSPEYLLK